MTDISVLRKANTVAGIKQVSRVVASGRASAVFIADDAAASLTAALRELCERSGVDVCACPSMEELGKACGLSVGAAACAVIR